MLAVTPVLLLPGVAATDWLQAQWNAPNDGWPVFESLRLMGGPFYLLATLAVLGSVPLPEANRSH